jgi:hypothetical protein
VGPLSRSTLLIGAPAALVGVVTVLRHEWWRDEAFTWLVVRESRSVGELLVALRDVGYGHPRLYYLLAYGLYQIAPWPLALSLTNLLLALLATALFVDAAPFTRAQKLMFALGYFPLYQYGSSRGRTPCSSRCSSATPGHGRGTPSAWPCGCCCSRCSHRCT